MDELVITLKIPDDGRQFKAYKGRELIAFTVEDTLYIKTKSCNYCGVCCMDYPNTVYGNDDEGRCNKLVKFGDVWECTAQTSVPWNCLDDPMDVPECCIEHKTVRIK